MAAGGGDDMEVLLQTDMEVLKLQMLNQQTGWGII